MTRASGAWETLTKEINFLSPGFMKDGGGGRHGESRVLKFEFGMRQIYSLDTEKTPNRVHSNKSLPRHTIIKLLENKDKDLYSENSQKI